MKSFKAFQFLIITLLFVFSIAITVYTIKAYSIAHYVYEEGNNAFWRYAPPGSFFPWPKQPGMLPTLSKMNETDLFIYRHFIKTWLIIILATLFWAVTCVYTLKRWPILKTSSQAK